MEHLLNNILPIILGSALTLIVSIIGSLIVYYVKEASSATKNNTHALIKLQVEIEHLRKSIQELNRLKPDVDKAHEKLRGLENRINAFEQ